MQDDLPDDLVFPQDGPAPQQDPLAGNVPASAAPIPNDLVFPQSQGDARANLESAEGRARLLRRQAIEAGTESQLAQNPEFAEATRAVTAARRAADAARGYGVFGESWGTMSPEEQQAWARGERIAADTEVQEAQQFQSTANEYQAQRDAEAHPWFGSPSAIADWFLRDLASSGTRSADRRQRDITAIEQGQSQPASLTATRSGVEGVARAVVDTAVAGIVKFAGYASAYATNALGLPTVEPDDNYLYNLGESISLWARDTFPGDTARQHEFIQKASQGLGSALGFLGPGLTAKLLGVGGPATATALSAIFGGAANSAEEFENATRALMEIRERRDADGNPIQFTPMERDRLIAAGLGFITGTSEAAPLAGMFAGRARAGWRGRLQGGAQQGVEELIQEGGQTVASNAVAAQTYDPDRPVTEGLGENAIIGGMTGFGMGAAARPHAPPSPTPPPVPAQDQVPPVPPQEPAGPQAAISGFYAPAERAMEASRRVQGPAQAWLNDLKKAGVSNDELDWMGFPQWMEENRGRPISREEVAEFVRENGANLVEMVQDLHRVTPVQFANNFPAGVTNPRNFLVQVPGLNYHSPHFGGPTISFIRVGDVAGPNGERVLLVHGNQSELHQEAEKSGYGDPSVQTGWETLDSPRAPVPNAPLKGDRWWQLGLKLALRQAVAEGYDAVAISTADQVKATDGNAPKSLYDSKMPSWLGKYVKPMGGVVEQSEAGTRKLPKTFASRNDAFAVYPRGSLTEKLTNNLWAVFSPGRRTIFGRDFGPLIGHVSEPSPGVFVATPVDNALRESLKVDEAQTRPLVRITPQMRESISKGQPLFAAHNSPSSRDPQEVAADTLADGGTYDVPIRVADGILNEIRTSRYLRMVPSDYDVGSLIMLERIEDGHPNGEVNAVFLTLDDTYTSMRLPLGALNSLGAIHVNPGYTDSGRGGVFFFRFDLPGEFGKRLAGELRHEAGHALRSSGVLRGKVWTRLLDHARSLSSMGMSVSDYLFLKGDAYWQNSSRSTTVKDAYTRLYEGRPDFQEVMDQEHVMIMLELHHHGFYSDEQMAPVRDILDAMESGALVGGQGVRSAEPAMAIAGPRAKTASKGNLAQAQKMAQRGRNPNTIWEATGWGLDPADSKWKWEIDARGGTTQYGLRAPRRWSASSGPMFAIGGGPAPSRGPSMAPAQSGAALRPVIADGTDPVDARQQMEAILRDELGFASVSISPGAEERAEAGIKAYRLIAELAGIPPNAIGRRAQIWFQSTAGKLGRQDISDMFRGLHFGYFKWISPASWFGRSKIVVKSERDSPYAAAEVAAHEWAHAFDHRAGQQQPVYRNFRAGGPKTLASTQFRISRMFNPIRILGYVFPAVKPVTDVIAQERAWDFRRNYFWMRPEMGQAWLDLTSALSRGETGFFSRVSGLAKAGVTKLQGRSVGAKADAARERVQQLEEKLEQAVDTDQFEVVLAELKRAEEARERLSDQEYELHKRNETNTNVALANTTFVDRSRRASRYHRKSYEMVARSFQTWLLDRAERAGYEDSQLKELFPDARYGRQGLSFQRSMLKTNDENYDAVMNAWDRIFAALDVKPDSGQMMFAIGGGGPVSLVSFIRAHGGMKDTTGDIRQILDKSGTKGHIPGIINNKTGVHPDRMRGYLVEAGYLKESGPDQPAITTVNDVYDLVRRAASGEKILPFGEQPSLPEPRTPERDQIINEAVRILDSAGMEYYLTEAEEARVVGLVNDGLSIDDAIERATMESGYGIESGDGKASRKARGRPAAQGEEFPGWEPRAELPRNEGAGTAGVGEGRAPEAAGTGIVPVTPPPVPPSSGGGSGMAPPGGGRGGRGGPPGGEVIPPDGGRGGPPSVGASPTIDGSRNWSLGDWARAARDKWYSLGRTMETWWNPINGLPQLEQYRIGRYRMLGRIGHGETMTNGIWKDFKGASKADKKAAYTYLTTRGVSPNGITDPKVRAAAVTTKNLFNALGIAAVDRGLISQEALDKYRDQYLPRLYLEHILRKGSMLGFSGNARPSDLGWTKHRGDIDKETRVLMGEILDPGYLAARGIFRMHRDMMIIDFLSEISNNDDWVFARGLAEFNGKRVSPYFLRAEAQALRERAGYEPDDGYRDAMLSMAQDMETAAAPFIRENENVPDGYKQIPDSKRYGMLRGMYVRKEIVDDLLPSMSLIPEDANWFEKFISPQGGGGKFNALWKAYHVPLNPSTQIRNMIGNVILMNLSGMGYIRVATALGKAVHQMATNGPVYKTAVDMGLKSSGFSEQELRNVSRAWLNAEATLRREGAYGTIFYPWQIIKHVHDTALRGAGDIYQFAEGLFKTAMMIDAVERLGMTHEQAFLHAQKWLFDYSDVSKTVRYIRGSPIGVPFASFFYKVLPRLMETAGTKPWRFIPYVILPYLMGEAFMNMWNAHDDEEERRRHPNRPNPVDRLAMSLPEYLRTKSYAFIMPWQDARGRWQFFDFGYLLPWGAFHEAGQSAAKGDVTGAMRQIGFLGGPLLNLYQFIASKGTDSFTGRKVIDPRDPASTQILNTMQWVWDQTAPPLITSKGALSKLFDAYNEVPDRSGDPGLTVAQAWSRLFGLNVYPVDPATSRGRQISRMAFEIREAEKRMRSIDRDQSLSAEARRRERETRAADIARRRRELSEYATNSEVHPRLDIQRPRRTPQPPIPNDLIFPQE